MAIGPEQIGEEIKLSEIDEAIANDFDSKIEKKLLLEKEGEGYYSVMVAVPNRLNENIVRVVETRYQRARWGEVHISTEGHTQFDSADEPFVYVIKLKA